MQQSGGSKTWWVSYAIRFIHLHIDSLPEIPIKGRGHGKRAINDKKNPIRLHLRTEKITGPRNGSVGTREWLRGRYCLERDLDLLRDGMLAIGVDCDNQTIIDVDAEKAAYAFWRMNDEIYPIEITQQISERIKDKLARKERKTLRRQFQFD